MYNEHEMQYIRIYDENLTLIKEVSDFISLMYTERSFQIGEFELHVKDPDFDTYQLGYYIRVGDDPYMSGMIEYEYENGDGLNADASKDYTIKGYSLLGILYRRITVPLAKSDGYFHYKMVAAEDIIYDLLDKHVINPENSERKIPIFECAESQHRGKGMTMDLRYKTLTDVIEDVCRESGLSVRVALDATRKKLRFEVYQGVDRTQKDSNQYLVCRKYDRVAEQVYEHSTLATCNYAYVLGQGEGSKRTLKEIGDATGLERRELYVDARDIADEVEDEDGKKDETYDVMKSLEERGNEKLAECSESYSLEFSADPLHYGTRYTLGDKLKYISDDGYTTETGYVTEATHTWEGNQHNVSVVIGEAKATIMSAIKSAGSSAVVERVGIDANFRNVTAELVETKSLIANKIDADYIDAWSIRTGMLTADSAVITDLTVETLRINQELEATKITCKDLETDNATIKGKLTANEADIGTLTADNATIKGKLTANEAEITTLTADTATVKAELNAATANITLLSADSAYLKEAVAEKLSVDDFNASNATITNLIATKANITDLTAATGRITDLESDNVTVKNTLNAAVANIGDLTADSATIKGKLEAAEADITDLTTAHANVTGRLEAAEGNITTLTADTATISGKLEAAEGNILTLTTENATVKGRLNAAEGNIETLTTENTTVKGRLDAAEAVIDDLDATYARITTLNAATGRIDTLESGYADINTALIGKADIDLANVQAGSITTAMIGDGVVGTAQIANGSITDAKIVGLTASKITAGTLDAGTIDVVNLNADNITVGTINGQLIGAGSVDMEKLSEGVVETIDTLGVDIEQAKADILGVDSKIDSLEVGGRNLILKSDSQKVNAYGGANLTFQSGQTVDDWKASDAYRVTGTKGTSNLFAVLGSGRSSLNNPNDKSINAQNYTHSIYVKNLGDPVQIRNNSLSNTVVTVGTNEITRVVLQGVGDGTQNLQFTLNIGNGTNIDFIYWHPKIETGNLVTDWTPAPEDIDSAISTAQATADSAMSTADGKNTVFRQSTTPSTTGRKTGDVWFDTANDNRIHIWSGSAWTLSELGEDAIANLAITNAKIADATIQSAKIANLDAGKITTGTLDADRIAAGSIVASKIASNAITADKIAANAITSAKIQAGAVTASAISSSAVTADKISSGAITADKIAASAVTADKIVSGAITTDKIAAKAITANELATGCITAASGIIASIDASKITTGTLDAERIAAGSLSVGQLGDLQMGGRNLVLNSETRTPGTYGEASLTIQSGQTVSEWSTANAIRVTGTKGTSNFFATLPTGRNSSSDPSSVSLENQNYIHSIYIKNLGDALSVQNNNLSSTGVTVGTGETKRVILSGTGDGTRYLQFTFGIGSGTNIDFYCWHPQIEAGTVVSDWTPAPEDVTNAIADGSIANWCYENNMSYIDGGNIYTGTIEAKSIAAGTITADKLKTGTITSASGVIGSLDAGDIKTGTLSADRIGAKTITVDKLDSKAISVGSRNLILNSATKQITLYSGSGTYTAATMTTTTGVAVSEWGAKDAFTCSGTASSEPNGLLGTLITGRSSSTTPTQLQLDQEYVGSIYIKNNHSTNGVEVRFNGYRSASSETVTVNAGECKRITCRHTGNTTSAYNIQMNFYSGGGASTGYNFTYWHPQIEVGYFASDWSPAPEDISVENIYSTGTTTIDGGKITTGTITATAIAANTITAAKIATGAITADKIAASAITTDKIAANAITAAKISVDNLSAVSANLGTITTGKLQDTSGNISMTLDGTNSELTIQGAKLKIVGSNGTKTGMALADQQIGGNNLLYGTKKFDPDYWAIPSSWTRGSVGTNTSLRISGVSGSSYDLITKIGSKNDQTVYAGRQYTLSFWAKGSGTIQCQFYGTGNYFFIKRMENSQGQVTTSSTGNMSGSSTFTLSSSWTKYWVTWTVGSQTNHTSNGTTTTTAFNAFSPARVQICRPTSTDTTVEIYAPMFEEGNVASAWCEHVGDYGGDGVNLLDNSSFNRGDTSQWTLPTTSTERGTLSYTRYDSSSHEYAYKGNPALAIVRSAIGTSTGRVLVQNNSATTKVKESMKAGDQFTLSGYYYIFSESTLAMSGSVQIFCRHYESGSSGTFTDTGASVTIPTTATRSAWTYFETTGTIPYTNGGNFLFAVAMSGTVGMRISGIKIEKGTKATDWSMSENDKKFYTLADWCVDNDVTVIDGAKIGTGTIEAKSIAANAITSDKIDATNLEVNHVISKNSDEIKNLEIVNGQTKYYAPVYGSPKLLAKTMYGLVDGNPRLDVTLNSNVGFSIGYVGAEHSSTFENYTGATNNIDRKALVYISQDNESLYIDMPGRVSINAGNGELYGIQTSGTVNIDVGFNTSYNKNGDSWNTVIANTITKTATLHFHLTGSFASNTDTNILTIKNTSYCPKKRVWGSGYTGANPFYINVGTDGKVYVKCGSSALSEIRGTVSWAYGGF